MAKLSYYKMYMAKETVPSTSYLEIRLYPRNPASVLVMASGGAVLHDYNIVNSSGEFINSQVLPVFYFIKRNTKGFKIDWGWEYDQPTISYQIDDLYGGYIRVTYEAEGHSSENINEFTGKLTGEYNKITDPDNQNYLGFQLPYTIEIVAHVADANGY